MGLTLQRKSHLLEDSKEDAELRRPAYRRRRWQIGMLMFVIANLVGSTIQITTLPLPVLSTLQASGLVFNTICAALILSEPFTRWSFAGTILVAGGAVLIAAYGALPEPSHSLSQLLYLLSRTQFILWMVGTLLVVVLALVGELLLSRLQNIHSHRVRIWRGMCFGFSSGILAAHSLLVAKSAVELLVRTIADHHNQFDRWQSWAILLSLVFFALTQLYYLHRGLKLCSTSVLYPFVFCIYNIVAILDGLIYFQQTSRLPALHAGLIAVGTVILLMGVLALSWRIDEDGDVVPLPDAHTLLTPGMSLLEDTSTESESDDYDDDDDDDSDDDSNTLVSTSDNTFPPAPLTNEDTPLLAPSSVLGAPTPTPTAYNTLNPHNLHLKSSRSRQRLLSLPSTTVPASSATSPLISPTLLTSGPRRASTLAAPRHYDSISSPGALTSINFFGGNGTDTLSRRRKWGSRYRSASLPMTPEVRKELKRKKKRGKIRRRASRPEGDGEEEAVHDGADDERDDVHHGDSAADSRDDYFDGATQQKKGVLGWIKGWFVGGGK